MPLLLCTVCELPPPHFKASDEHVSDESTSCDTSDDSDSGGTSAANESCWDVGSIGSTAASGGAPNQLKEEDALLVRWATAALSVKRLRKLPGLHALQASL